MGSKPQTLACISQGISMAQIDQSKILLRRQLYLDWRRRFTWRASGMELVVTKGSVEDAMRCQISPCDRHRRMLGTIVGTNIQLRLICTGYGF